MLSMNRLSFLSVSLFFITMALPLSSHAIVSDFPPTIPSTKNVSIGKSTSVALTWRVTDTSGSLAGPVSVTVFSNTGTLCVGTIFVCTPLSTISKRLAVTYTGIGFPRTFNFRETVVVPLSVIQRAQKLGFSTLLYRRTWSPGATFPTGAITLNITGSAGAGFGISRQSMRFDDGSIIKLLNEKEALYAKSDVGYSGTGLLQAVWEVAGPTSTPGTPIFRRLKTIRKGLLFGSKKTFTSPLLPTQAAGVYLVRMRLTTPITGFEPPVIRYYVGNKGIQLAPPIPLQLGNPSDRSWLSKDTEFSWLPLKGAAYYRLEIHQKPTESNLENSLPSLGSADIDRKPIVKLTTAPISGVLLPADRLSSALSPATRERLIPGKWYYWRVVSLNKTGKIIGVSPTREIRVP